MKKNKKSKEPVHIKFQDGKRSVETWVDGYDEIKKFFNLVKETIFSGKDEDKKQAGFIPNEKNNKSKD
ncbi:hypothetical protein CL614_00180 [archaeon]|nr:hypothetical protein [archaeon]|tara:strand:+ start:269 stop:472 length:204 start_codon:yes stop_codon:yes gene_type:complete